MRRRKLSSAQKNNQAMMEAANETAQMIMADEALRHAAQIRLNVTTNKLYTALIREYFSQNKAQSNIRQTGKSKKP
jgi:vacuolar-type H+-ATPase subunit E/Vma4